MKSNMRGIVRGGIVWVMSLAFVSVILTSCSDDKSVAGGSTEDAGIIATLDVAGMTQKGPFVKGSVVTVQGIDCKTLELTDEHFESKVKSDKGDFTVEDVSLKSSCALFAVTGIYRSEITGKKTSKELTLYALTDLKNRKNVNINILTNLEYERLMYLVTEKGKKFAEAKAQAEKEVLAAFDIKGDFEEFENLNIFEAGDENAALLAVSVMMQAETDDAGLAKRLDKFADSFAETGKWKDSTTKAAISEWAAEATASGELETIRRNIESWDIGDVPAFEKFIEAYADGDSIVLIVTPKSSSSETSVSSSSRDTTYNAEKNTLTDTRDGQVYRTVKIGNQVWMAENLNVETDSSFCYNDSAEYCAKYGRLYEWSAAMEACPSGWHLPDTAEWRTLLDAAGGDSIAGTMLKSTSGWNSDGNGTDDFGFTVLPAGGWGSKNFVGEAAVFWTSEWYEGYDDYAYDIKLYTDTIVRKGYSHKYIGSSVRCVKGSATAPKSSSSSENVILSGDSHEGSSSSPVTLATPCKTETEDNCEYGTLTDSRDGQTYKTVKIGDQVWMAENLNIAAPNSYCYHDSAEYCSKYGRLYNWAGAMDAEGKWSTNSVNCRYTGECSPTYPVRGACPEGWHLPDSTEWGKLLTAVGGLDVAAKMLKSTSGWQDCEEENCNGTDVYGFSALPAGYMDRYGSAFTYCEGVSTGFYTSTQVDKNDAYRVYLYRNNVVNFTSDIKAAGFSVRCVKDDVSAPESSSSEVSSPSSSSVALATPCKTETEDNCEYGTLTDFRDGQTYKTVKIGEQIWMAENLNYAYTGVLYNNSGYTSDSTSWCFGNDPANCIKYGRLYTWAAAMDSVGTWSTNGKDCGYGVQSTPIYPVRGICPEGWHLPDKAEWNTLFTAVGGASTAGKMLSSTISWSSVPGGWVRDGYGTDAYSFSALPAGLRNATGYNNVGYHAYFWSSSEYNSSRTYIVGLDDEFDKADLYGSGKDYGYSVRCVKD